MFPEAQPRKGRFLVLSIRCGEDVSTFFPILNDFDHVRRLLDVPFILYG